MRLLGLGSVVAIVGIAGAAGAITIRGNTANVTETSTGSVAIKQEGVIGRKVRPTRELAPIPESGKTEPSTAKTEPAIATKAAEPPPSAPTPPAAAANVRASETATLLGPGRTVLADSIFALRTGDSVMVNFDTHGNRTRRADKFEVMVRNTLPLVYGKRSTAALDSIPEGSLLPSRDVLGDLRAQGLHLHLANGKRIAVWPQARETSDGPLVVAYWVVIER
jgi:hypothetical protein